MDSVTTAEARKQLAELVNRVAYGKERVVLTRHGREVAAVVPLEDLRLLERLRVRMTRRQVRRALKEVQDRGSVPWEALREALDL
ncbi:MAG: type II toxin-antitoxin system Phd/YefM family antitoxin [Gemmatimonadota bacterium]